MNKGLLVGIGASLLIIGLIAAFFAGNGLISNITVSNMFSHLSSYLIEAAIAITLLVVGGILLIVGISK
jgi:hypothetical protein